MVSFNLIDDVCWNFLLLFINVDKTQESNFDHLLENEMNYYNYYERWLFFLEYINRSTDYLQIKNNNSMDTV